MAVCLGLLLLTLTLLGFLFLLVLSQASRNQSLQFLVLKFLLSLDEIRLVPHWGLGNQQRSTGQEGDSEMEAGDKGIRWSVPAQIVVSNVASEVKINDGKLTVLRKALPSYVGQPLANPYENASHLPGCEY